MAYNLRTLGAADRGCLCSFSCFSSVHLWHNCISGMWWVSGTLTASHLKSLHLIAPLPIGFSASSEVCLAAQLGGSELPRNNLHPMGNEDNGAQFQLPAHLLRQFWSTSYRVSWNVSSGIGPLVHWSKLSLTHILLTYFSSLPLLPYSPHLCFPSVCAKSL